MASNLRRWVFLTTIASLATVVSITIRAEEPAATSETPATEDASPADSSLQREYARLAQLLNSPERFGRNEAVSALARVRPSDIADAGTRKLIARGYRSLALEDSLDFEEAVRGLVIWGGKYSVPVLIELMEDGKRHSHDEIILALSKFDDPRGAAAIARCLGNFFNHEAAVNALRRMGPAAEDALIEAAPSNDVDISLAAVQILGQVGGEKSLDVLQRATTARGANYKVKEAARDAIKRIHARQEGGDALDLVNATDPDSPFAEGAGPAVDLTVRNTRDFAMPDFVRGQPNAGGALGRDNLNADGEEFDEGDWADVRALWPGEPAAAGLQPDPPRAAVDLLPQPARLGDSLTGSERPVSVSVAGGDSPRAVVIYDDPQNEILARMEYVDLRSERSAGSTNVLGGVKGCLLSPSSMRVLLRAEEGFTNRRARFDVWAFGADGKPVEQTSWWPFATSKGHWANRISWTAWVDDEQLFTANGEGTVVLWRLDGKRAKAVYQLDARGNCTPALSAGRAHLALATPRGVEVFRVSDGELLARMSEVRPGAGVVTFNAKGTRLACVSRASIYVWDATTGDLYRDFDCSGLGGGAVSWLDDDHLLVGNDVVDINRRLILWRYQTANLPATTQGTLRWQLMKNGNVLGLVPTQLMGQNVRAAAEGIDPEAILALKPGVKVSLNVQVGGDDRAKAESALRAAVERSGMEVAPNQPVQITARIVTGRSETIDYRIGSFRDETHQQATVSEKLYEVELTVDGQSAWKQSSQLQSGRAPHLIQMRRGESAQQAVDRENAERAAGFSFSASIPRYLVHPQYAGPLGTSPLTSL